ncbi:MAG: branched-chain amino acid ABC transporter permease [Desulfarculus sp.]|nr:branched-chain amino acid ABC transporter permease [Desulfarculus sp.]
MTGQAPTPVQMERQRQRARRYTRPGFLIQLALLACLVAGPMLMPSFRVMDLVAKIMIFAVAVASFDIILGYTGIISFAHGMFFGLGAYSVALICHYSQPVQYHHLLLAGLLAALISAVVAVVISALSLRVKAIFFAMVTLAVAEFCHILGYQWSSLTKGEDGVSFKLPGVFNADWSGGSLWGTQINGRLLVYYLILVVAVLLFVGLVRFVRSPVGRVLKAIRDNEQRATALGYRVFRYRVLSTVFGSLVSSLCGALFAMWLSYVNPDTVLGTPLMLNILLMVIIGGLGTVYGGILGAAFIKIAETWLPDLQKLALSLWPKVEFMQRLAERWILLFGILYILSVLFFPKGVVGTLRDRAEVRRLRRLGRP